MVHSSVKKTVRHYDKLAGRYEKQYQVYLKHTHGKLLEKLSLSHEDEVLDCSAGTGLLAQKILKRYGPFERLALNDPSTEMLERAKYRLRYVEDVEFYNHLSENLRFDDNSFSQIICLNSFHYYSDQKEVLGHFQRILKPGGNLWILDWNRTGSFKIANIFLDWFSPENINSRSLDEMRILLQDFGFEIKEEDQWGYRWWNFFFVRCEPV